MIEQIALEYLMAQLPVQVEQTDPQIDIVFWSKDTASNKDDISFQNHAIYTSVGHKLQNSFICQYVVLNCWQDEDLQSALVTAISPTFSDKFIKMFDALQECFLLANDKANESYRNNADVDPDTTSRLIAYTYYKNGFSSAYNLVSFALEKMDLHLALQSSCIRQNAKTILQEIAQRIGNQRPMYKTNQSGEMHKSVFTCTVSLSNKSGHGRGQRIKEAESEAATDLIQRYFANDQYFEKYKTPFTHAVFHDKRLPSARPSSASLQGLGLDGQLFYSCLCTNESITRVKGCEVLGNRNTNHYGDQLLGLLISLVEADMVQRQKYRIAIANDVFPRIHTTQELYSTIAKYFEIREEMKKVNNTNYDLSDQQIIRSARAVIALTVLHKVSIGAIIEDLLQIFDKNLIIIIQEHIKKSVCKQGDIETREASNYLSPSNTLHTIAGICSWELSTDTVMVPYREAPASMKGMAYKAIVSISIGGRVALSGQAMGINKKEAISRAKASVWDMICKKFIAGKLEDPLVKSVILAEHSQNRSPNSRKLLNDLLISLIADLDNKAQ